MTAIAPRAASRHLLVLLGILLPVLAGCGGDSSSRVLVLGLDGVDPRTVDQLLAEGKLPNFARLRRDGAYGRLRSFKPLLSPILWTTVATGKTADEHGIGHFVAVDPESGREVPATSEMRRVEALWNIASAAGRRTAVVGWWATWPPEELADGVVVSDHTAYHFLFDEGLSGGDTGRAIYPSELADELAAHLVQPADIGRQALAGIVEVSDEELAGELDFDDDLSHLRWALSAAHTYRNIGLELWQRQKPELAMVYVEAVDSTSHLFGHLHRSEGLVGELSRQQQRFGGAVEGVYRLADEILGDFLDVLDRRTTLVVLSDHGFDLGILHDDPSKTRDLRRVSERFHNEMGILYLYGRGVRAGVRLEGVTLLDVAPTVLALLGLPAAEDMPGRILDSALREVESELRIASYETDGDGRPAQAPPQGQAPATPTATATDEAMLKRLRSLGYLSETPGAPNGGNDRTGEAAGAASPQSLAGERNLAAIDFERGQYARAIERYRRLIEIQPEEPSLRTSLAGVLGTLGRYDEAEAELRTALELEPVNPEALHNLGVIWERRGGLEQAVEHYRWAARYAPDYDPPRHALRRLTGSAEPREPRSEQEARAWAVAEQASLAARRGDYENALERLDEAESLAPDSVLIFQYRSNVAYLMGDVAAAIAALERALELEPGNELFRRNLEQLDNQQR